MSIDFVRTDSEPVAFSLEEILNRPKAAAVQMRAAKRKRQSRLSKYRWIASIGTLLVLFPMMLWMSGVLSVQTPNGTIVFDKLPENADVFVDGKEVQVTWDKGREKAMVSIVPGTHQVKVVDGEQTSMGERVTIGSGQKRSLSVRWSDHQRVPNATPIGSAPTIDKQTGQVDLSEEAKKLLSRQLLLNPGNEEPLVEGQVADWQSEGVAWNAKPLNGNDTPAFFGRRYFAALESQSAELSQVVDITPLASRIDLDTIQVTFRGATISWLADHPDTSEAILEYLAADRSTSLLSITTGESNATDQWKRFELTQMAPKGARYLKVRLISHRRQGRSNDGYFDDLSLVLNDLEIAVDAKLDDQTSKVVSETESMREAKGSVDFISLWNGKDMAGWNFPFGQGVYAEKEGVLDVTYGRNLYEAIVTDRNDFANFHTKWTLRIDGTSPGGDSNIQFFLRSKYTPEDLSGWQFALGGKKAASVGTAGLGHFTLKTGGPPTAQHLSSVAGGEENDLVVTGEALPPLSRDEWHVVEFLARGNHIDMIVDQKLVTSVVDQLDRISYGQLALRAQWNTRIEFKSIETKELGKSEEANEYADKYLASVRGDQEVVETAMELEQQDSASLESQDTAKPISERLDAQPELLQNPGNEVVAGMAAVPGWVVEKGNWRKNTLEGFTPKEGQRYFQPENVKLAILSQTVTLEKFKRKVDAQSMLVRFRGYVQTDTHSNADQASLKVQYLDMKGAILHEFKSQDFHHQARWALVEHSQTIPEKTRAIRIVLVAERLGGVWNQGLFDDMSLKVLEVDKPIDKKGQ